ncbi:ankyrin repeat protein [Flavobacterium sp. 90]|uniref:ankyrin repeat domain-containing protein n=1 Tax=unclassified Flavobacterium TaxID=196869 RepID=UPI000EAF8860|nr:MULTISPECIES: ankyrin repeat domain-containing protein [unclassified Flavobacterium]RKR04802.1 ankyrin repeat protein [Flavobacterium sp. 81]TCK56123.1 ankyrin repeat protein [Flavobacterium sp. 90]
MKKNIFLSFAFAATLFVSAQQKNTLLEASFWKTAPDVTAVQAEIAKGNNPSEANANAFDVTTLAINNDAPLATIKFLLDQPGNPVNKMTHDNRIYLHWAAYRGNIDLAQYLITKGSDVNLEDSHATTPLAFAASNGQINPALYEVFFKAGINPKKKYADGATLLLMAIPADKDLVLTDFLVTKGLSLKDVDTNGSTAFDYAARTGNIVLLKKLLDKKVKYTDNALLIASQGNRRETTSLEAYKFLVEEVKIKATATNKSGENVLHFLATKPNQKEIIAYFLAKGVDVNKANNEGNTPFMLAAGARENGALEQLLATAKNINLKNTKGESALTIAVKSGTPEAVSALLAKGADVKVTDKDGNNLGVYLVQSFRPGAKQESFDAKVKLLQEKGLDLAAAQKDGSTLYHFAVAKNELSLIKKLADLKIDVNAKNKDGMTALHKAAMIAKDDAILKYLLSIGAKKDITTEFDESAYALAKENESLTKQNISIEFLK